MIKDVEKPQEKYEDNVDEINHQEKIMELQTHCCLHVFVIMLKIVPLIEQPKSAISSMNLLINKCCRFVWGKRCESMLRRDTIREHFPQIVYFQLTIGPILSLLLHDLSQRLCVPFR